MDPKLLGKANYESFAKTRSYGLPLWDRLSEATQASWIAAAQAVLEEARRQETAAP
jgi:hypothetical protein